MGRLGPLRPTVLGALGAGLLLIPSRRFRPDLLLCQDWPPLPLGAAHGCVYLSAVALLSLSWLEATRRLRGRGTGAVLLLGAPVHLVALLGAPFLSQDTLFYAAIGRSLAAGGRPDQPVIEILSRLPGAARFLEVLPPHWRPGTSTYGPLWNALATAIGAVAGDRLWLHLRLHQAVGLGASLATAALVGRAAGGGAAALVLFCPLLVIEGTQGAHNDGLLAVCAAAFALLLQRRRPLPALLSLAAGLLVKASAALLPGLWAAAALLRRLRGRDGTDAPGRRGPALARGTGRRRLAALVTLGACVASLALLFAPGLLRLTPVAAALGSAEGPYEYCTRSVECLPRALLRYVLGQPRLAYGVSLLFRGLGLLWLLRCAEAAGRESPPGGGRTLDPRALLRHGATFLFGYYLYLHGWSQSWYLLTLLPLLPYADPRLRPAMTTLCLSALAYYALAIPLTCVRSEAAIAATDLAEALVVIAPPTVVLFRSLRHGNTPDHR